MNIPPETALIKAKKGGIFNKPEAVNIKGDILYKVGDYITLAFFILDIVISFRTTYFTSYLFLLIYLNI